MPINDARKVDLGYASTSHAGQGSTVHRAIVHIDSSRRAELVNMRQFYVSGTHPEWDLRIYTDSVQGMRRAVARTQEKELALDVTPQHQYRQSAGLRIWRYGGAALEYYRGKPGAKTQAEAVDITKLQKK